MLGKPSRILWTPPPRVLVDPDGRPYTCRQLEDLDPVWRAATGFGGFPHSYQPTVQTIVIAQASVYRAIQLPDCAWIRITCQGPGGSGNTGTTGTNAANRSGGMGGGSGGWSTATWQRWQLPDVLYCRPGGVNASGEATLVELMSSGYTVSTLSTANAGNRLIYANFGGFGASGGVAGAAANSQLAVGIRTGKGQTLLPGSTGTSSASGQPTDANPAASGVGPAMQGCGGAGKASAGPTDAAGGGYTGIGGQFAARAGGAAGSGGVPGNGTDGFGGDALMHPIGVSRADELLWSWGGTGGGSTTSGTGGSSGNAGPGAGGGGGGAGTVAGGALGAGGQGWIVIEAGL